jgi:hypothetical protein
MATDGGENSSKLLPCLRVTGAIGHLDCQSFCRAVVLLRFAMREDLLRLIACLHGIGQRSLSLLRLHEVIGQPCGMVAGLVGIEFLQHDPGTPMQPEAALCRRVLIDHLMQQWVAESVAAIRLAQEKGSRCSIQRLK